MPGKRILVLGAGIFHIPIFAQLKSAGFKVFIADKNPNAPGASCGDVFRPVDITDISSIQKYVEEEKIDGIMPLNERGVLCAATVSHHLGLRGLDPQNAWACIDKGSMRTRWKEAGLSIPAFEMVYNQDELTSAAERVGYPLVLKPTDNGGSGRGISIVRKEKELEEAYQFALPYINQGAILVESFFEGVELTVETFSLDGEVYFLAMSDKEKPDLKTRVAMSLNYPANISEEQEKMVKREVKEALLSLGISGGMAHTEVIVSEDKMILVETGARGGGGHIFHTIIEAVSGISAPVLYAQWLCGEEIQMPEIQKKGAVYRFLETPRGILKAITGLEEIKQLPYLLDAGMVKQIGEEVGNLENSQHRAGHLVVSGKDRAQALERAKEAASKITFTIEALA